MKRRTIFIISVMVLVIVAAATGILFYNKPHLDMKNAKTKISISAVELLDAFESDHIKADSAYTGKVIEVTGEIQAIDRSNGNILLADPSGFYGINCSFSNPKHDVPNNLIPGETITIKGECKGYIDDVILTNCLVTK